MDRGLRGFVQLYLLIVAIFFVIGLVLARVLHQDIVFTLAEVYFWVGIGYVAASTLAWSGVANVYRYSPTLFIGSRSYREQIIRSKLWQEGRDDASFLLGLGFGGALLGLGAALIDPVFILVDVLVVAVVLLVLHAMRSRAGTKS